MDFGQCKTDLGNEKLIINTGKLTLENKNLHWHMKKRYQTMDIH